MGYSVEVDDSEKSERDDSFYLSDEASALVIHEDEENAEDDTWCIHNNKSSLDDDDEEWTFQRKPAKRNREGKALLKSTNASSSNSSYISSSYNIDALTVGINNVWLLDHNYGARHQNQTRGESQTIENIREDGLPFSSFDQGTTDRITDNNVSITFLMLFIFSLFPECFTPTDSDNALFASGR